MRYARRCNEGEPRDDDEEIVRLRSAVLAVPCRPTRCLDTYSSESHLRTLIESAFVFLAGQERAKIAPTIAITPHYPMPTQTVADARHSLATVMRAFLKRVLAWSLLDEHERGLPEHAGIMTAVGSGKSLIGRELVCWLVAASRAAGLSSRVLWLAPYHRLNNETLAEMMRLGINAAVMRGHLADDPACTTFDPITGKAQELMCRDPESVKAGNAIHADIEREICGSDKPGAPCCRFRTGPKQCPYWAQKLTVAAADVVIAANQALFNAASSAVKRDLVLAVVDEGWSEVGLAAPTHINLAGLADEVKRYLVRNKDGSANQGDTDELAALCQIAESVPAAHPDGAFVEQTAIAARLTTERCSVARAIEYNRLVKGALIPGMTEAARKDAVAMSAGNAAVFRRAGMWDKLEMLLSYDDEVTGRLQLGVVNGAEGARRVVIAHSRREIRPHIADLPILMLDATMSLRVVREFLPRLTLLADVNSVAPHATYRQVIGGWGRTSLCPNPKAAADDPENKRRAHNVGLLSDFVALNSDGNALVVTYKEIEARFQRPGVRTAHFGAVAGRDEFKDVTDVFVIGRPLASPQALRQMALALTGQPIPEQQPRKETRGVLMADGTGAPMDVWAYEDATLESLRASIADSAPVQAPGRGRAINRTESSPVAIWLFADVVTPMPITQLLRWVDIRPDCLQQMAARGLVLFSPKDAAATYPELFPTEDAARMAMVRAGGIYRTSPYESTPIGACSV